MDNLTELMRRTEDHMAEHRRGRAAAAADGNDAAAAAISLEIGATRQTLDELRAHQRLRPHGGQPLLFG